jgi:pimeloyl-ACP methyl ester carboxylesterase
MKKIFTLFLLTCTIIVSLLMFATKSVYALELKHFTYNDKTLYDETNTFEYKTEFSNKPNIYDNNERYNFSASTNIEVDIGTPLLTVFTHGLYGDASHWSNNSANVFAYSEHSLITRLAKLIDSNIYWVIIDEYQNLKIMDVTNELYDSINSGNPVIYDGIEINHITDVSRHSIVIFEAFSSGGINDEVYTEFNYAISRIVHDIRVVNDGLLPKMNLIGHSRGGITNMQYALDHPDLVHSIYR